MRGKHPPFGVWIARCLTELPRFPAPYTIVIHFRCYHCGTIHPASFQTGRALFRAMRETEVEDRCPTTGKRIAFRLREAVFKEPAPAAGTSASDGPCRTRTCDPSIMSALL